MHYGWRFVSLDDVPQSVGANFVVGFAYTAGQ
jgi:hypothetical protein